LWNLCSVCGKPIIAIYDLKKLRKALKKDELVQRYANLWRYRELLPIQDSEYIVSLGEGYTPLIHARHLGKTYGVKNLYIKDESRNPTGSFRARGMSVAISRAMEVGVKEISLPSAGNAAGAASAYAARGGIKAFVYMPKTVPKTFVIECIAMGATVELVDGLITDCAKKATQDANQHGRFDLSTLKEPYRIEGKKTMGFEIAEQMGWRFPDVIVYPTGGGTGLIGMWKAFEELQNLGWVKTRLPRMVAVQSEGCAPIVRAFRSEAEQARSWHDVKTIADGLRVPATIGDFLILRTLRESRGTAVTVSDQDILDAINQMSSTEGIFCCPEGAATLAAFKLLHKQGWIKDKDTVVLFNTASGLKYAHLWAQDLRF
jgi:threonine synthase